MNSLPDELHMIILEYAGNYPSQSICKKLNKSKTFDNLKKYERINSEKYFIIWKCMYCHSPKWWTKFEPELKKSRFPFYKPLFLIGCNC